MERMEEYAEEESPFTEPENLPRDPIHEDLTTNSLSLLQTVKDLKSEMESVKKENERILRAQEELNQILTERFQTEGRGKRADSEDISYQHKYKKIKQAKNESSSSSEVFGDQRNFHSTSDSSEDNHYTRKRKYKPYEEISREFKKIKPPTFNGENEKGEEAKSWLSRMKKYFQI